MKTLENKIVICAALIAAVSFAPCLVAQMDSPSTPSSATPASTTSAAPNAANLTHGDRTFFRKAAEGGMKEVTVSQAVMGQLTNPQVKDFAQTMVRDHTEANTELAGLAANKGVTLPAPDNDLAGKWSKKDSDTDKDYVEEMVSDHKDVVKLFEKASKSSDPDIAAFAQKMLPTLQHHLEMAQSLKQAL